MLCVGEGSIKKRPICYGFVTITSTHSNISAITTTTLASLVWMPFRNRLWRLSLLLVLRIFLLVLLLLHLV